MAERRVRRNRNLTSGSMALNVSSNALPKRRYLPDEHREIVKRPKKAEKKQKYVQMKYAPSIDFFGFAGLMIMAVISEYTMRLNRLRVKPACLTPN